MLTADSSSWANPSINEIIRQGYDSELRQSYLQRSWMRVSTMTANQAVAQRLLWKDSYISDGTYVYDTGPRV